MEGSAKISRWPNRVVIFSNGGGEIRYSLNVARAMSERGIQCSIYVPNDQSALSAVALQDQVKVVPRLANSTSMARHLNAFWVLWTVFSERPHLVHFQGALGRQWGGLFGEPFVAVAYVLRALGVPLVFSFHSPVTRAELLRMCSERGYGWLRTKLTVSYVRWLYARMVKGVACTSLVCAGATSHVLLQFCHEFGVVPGAVVAEVHPFERDTAMAVQRESSAPVILALGYLRRSKGFHLLLACADEILDKLPQHHILIVGEAGNADERMYRDELRATSARLKQRARVSVITEGVDDGAFSAYLQNARCVVLPYTRGTGASGPLHRALSAGKAVVASTVAAGPGFEGSCLQVPPGDSKELGAAIISICSNPKLRQSIEESGRRLATDHTWETLLDDYLVNYRYISTKRRRV